MEGEGVVCCDLEPGISRKPAINSSACIRRFVLLPTRLIFQIRFINLFFFDPILAHRQYSCIVSASAVPQGFFKGRPTNISSFKNYTSSVEATATNLRQRGDSLSSAKSYVLHIGRLARFGTFVSSEEAVWRRREYEDEIFTAR